MEIEVKSNLRKVQGLKFFRGYVIKEQHGDDKECEIYYELNKIIIKKYKILC